MSYTLRRYNGDKYSWIQFLMKRSYKSFLDNNGVEKNIFLNDLSVLLAYPESEFKIIDIRKGCVILEASLPRVAVSRVMSLWKMIKSQSKNHPDESEEEVEFREFVKKHLIRDIIDSYSNNRKLGILTPHKQSHSKTSKAVIFIHGWRFEGSLYKGENSIFGILERPTDTFGRLPEQLYNTFDASTTEYQYPTGIIAKKPSFYDIAKHFNNQLEEYLQEHLEKSFPEVCLIGHSAGGVVIRKSMTLTVFRERRDEYVRQITFIACPYTGVDALRALCWFFPNDQVQQLCRDSAFISELNDKWQQWKKEWKRSQFIRCIYSPEDTVVSKVDATIDDPEAVPILGLDHVKVKEANCPNSEVVKTIISFLQDAGFRNL